MINTLNSSFDVDTMLSYIGYKLFFFPLSTFRSQFGVH